MSYEKKMKDLMARLVAMSPEPPPYPDETPMAAQSQLRRARPALVFAAAAVLVVVLAVPLLLFTGGEGPGPAATSTTNTTVVTTTLVPDTTSTSVAPSTTTTTVPALETWSGVVFFYQEPENSFSSNPALVPVPVMVEGSFEEDVDFSRAIAAVVAEGGQLPAGLQTAIPPDVVVESTTGDGATVIADMNEAFLDGAGGLLADFTMLNQLIYTLTHDSYESVMFTVNGEPVEAFGGEGLSLTEPVDRESFREGNLALIFVTQPLVESEGAYLVEGMANVTEATLSMEVIDGEETVVHEETVTASCGTGCWGDFSATIPAELIIPGESSVRLLTHSLEDGSDTEVITVAIPDGDVWQLTARD